jgi:hypothetical protein
VLRRPEVERVGVTLLAGLRAQGAAIALPAARAERARCPWTEELIAVARKHERVYIDTFAYTSRRLPPELVIYELYLSANATRVFKIANSADD